MDHADDAPWAALSAAAERYAAALAACTILEAQYSLYAQCPADKLREHTRANKEFLEAEAELRRLGGGSLCL